MVHRIKQLVGSRICAADGEIGHIDDVYFDDERWVIRYVVVDTGGWLTGRKVLISPYGVSAVDFDAGRVSVNLTRRQIEHSPDVDTDTPVSREYELAYLDYYGYPSYWPYTTMWPWGSIPTVTPPDARILQPVHLSETRAATISPAQRHLRSTNEVLRYHIRATDDFIGHAEDALFDNRSWSLRFLVIDTRNWWPGRRVLVAPAWIDEVDWPGRSIRVAMTRSEIERCPEYDPDGRLPAGVARSGGTPQSKAEHT